MTAPDESPIRDLFEQFPELASAKVQFWTCLNPEHRNVTWEGDVARCPACGLTSEMVKKFAKDVQAYERERIRREAGERRHVLARPGYEPVEVVGWASLNVILDGAGA